MCMAQQSLLRIRDLLLCQSTVNYQTHQVQIYGLQHLQSYRALRLMRNLQSPCARGSRSCRCASQARTYT